MDEVDIPEAGKAYIVHYDEQFPKKGRCQKFRLTLLDAKTKKPIAEELFDDKDSPTIKEFLMSNLDINEPIYCQGFSKKNKYRSGIVKIYMHKEKKSKKRISGLQSQE